MTREWVTTALPVAASRLLLAFLSRFLNHHRPLPLCKSGFFLKVRNESAGFVYHLNREMTRSALAVVQLLSLG